MVSNNKKFKLGQLNFIQDLEKKLASDFQKKKLS